MPFITQDEYRKQVMTLARSLVIKSKGFAWVTNKYLKSTGVDVNETAPRTWKYYRHLAGEYHATDTMMKVISLDTHEVIDFTYNNLRIHRATYNDYRTKGDYYKELVATYPEQEDLIDGILAPVDIDKAIAADDFTILGWDESQVISNETNLIPKLQEYLTAVTNRWYNHNYCYLFDEYPAKFMTDITMLLPSKIINIRKANQRTEFVHPYHLWAYLGSHQRLDKYRETLTHEQAMWLYRNIEYLEAHPGWNHSFVELIEWLLSKRNIPLTSFSLAHNLQDVVKDIAPASEVLKEALNDQAFSSSGIKKTTIASVLENEIPLAKNNEDYFTEQLVSVPQRFQLSSFSSLETKVLESDMIDRSDAQPVHFLQTLFNQWIYLVSKGEYKASVTMTNQYTSEVLVFTAREAVAVWLYCLHRQLDVTLEYVPTFLAHHVMRPIAPTFSELRSMSPYKYISEEMILAVLEEHVVAKNILSIEKFNQTVRSIHNSVTRLRYLYATMEDMHVHGYMKNLVLRVFMQHRCVIMENTKYHDLFALKGWNLESMTRDQYEDFGNQLFTMVTGLDLRDINSTRAVQNAMISLLKQLSSYSIQFLSRINDSSYTVLDRGIVRLGDIEAKASIRARLGISVSPIHDTGKSMFSVELPVGNRVAINDKTVKVTNKIIAYLNPTVKFTPNTAVRTNLRLKLPLAKINLKRALNINNNIGKFKLIGVYTLDVKEGVFGDDIGNYIDSPQFDPTYPDPFGELTENVQ